MRGKTLFFLSADKTVRVYIGTEEVYSFGENDVRLFGHTPGSVYCFINIPDDADNEIIRMEMSSYYENYATYMPEIRIADRDVAILTLLKENLLSFFYCVVIAMTGVVLFVLGIIQKLSKKEEDGMTYLGLLLLDNDMDGISLKAISEKLSHLETSLIVMCDNHNLQTVIDKEKIIIDDYIVKPLNSLQLNEMVHSVLN